MTTELDTPTQAAPSIGDELDIHEPAVEVEENLFDSLITGVEDRARGLLLYGEQGVGKTFWAGQTPKPFFLRCEDGGKELAVDKTPILEDMSSVRKWVRAFLQNSDQYTHFVVDTIDWLVALFEHEVATENGVESVSQIPYGKGPGIVAERVRGFLKTLDKIKAKGVDIVLLGHSIVKKIDLPNCDPYDQFDVKLGKYTCEVVKEWADEVFFLHWDTDTIKEDAGFGRKKAKAIAQTRRIATQNQPFCSAKCRLPGVPKDLDATWEAFKPYREQFNE